MVLTVFLFIFIGAAMITLLPFALLALLLSLAGFGKPMRFLVYKMAQAWARIILSLTGSRITVRGQENIPKKGGICFVANHVGIVDILLALGYAGRPFGFIAKKELLFVPGLNVWVLILGGLFIDRKQPRKALMTIHKGIRRIRAGAGMLIFPEGTRSRGHGIAPFRSGALKLATQSDAVIVPAAITGTYEVFEKRGRACASVVYLSFLPPVRVQDIPLKDRKQTLSNHLHDTIACELERHKAESGSQTQA